MIRYCDQSGNGSISVESFVKFNKRKNFDWLNKTDSVILLELFYFVLCSIIFFMTDKNIDKSSFIYFH